MSDVRAIRFRRLRAGEKERWWLLGNSEGIDLCLTDPGFEVDLFVTTEVRTLTRVGDLPLRRVIQNAGIERDGPARLRKAFPQPDRARFKPTPSMKRGWQGWR